MSKLKKLGEYICQVDVRNRDLSVDKLLFFGGGEYK